MKANGTCFVPNTQFLREKALIKHRLKSLGYLGSLTFSLSSTLSFVQICQAEPLLSRVSAPASGLTVQQLLAESNSKAAVLLNSQKSTDWTASEAIFQLSQLPDAPAKPSAAEPIAQVPSSEEDDLLNEVSVTATRRPTRQRDTTATTYTVKKEDFRAQAAQTATDALQYVPGFQGFTTPGGVASPGGGGGNPFFLRGFDDQRFQILRDGISLQRSGNGRTDISRLPVESLERIEVVTGGATLRYGAGAVGGVINLITETPKGPPKLTLEYQTGSYGFSKYVAKYGGGDDTFSYNFVYSGLVAFNNYPYRFTLPNQATFYGPTVNQNASVPSRINPTGYPNQRNSFGVGGSEAADPRNNGSVDLFGYLTPEVGPPITVTGINSTNTVAIDSYNFKLSWKPEPTDRITISAELQNYKSLFSNPGNTYRNACFGGASTATNPVISLNRFFPLVPDASAPGGARILPCDQQRYIVRTPTSQQALPFNYNTSLDGRIVFPTGQSYPFAEQNTTDAAYYATVNQTQFDGVLNWDHDITPTASLNTYVAYYRFASPRFVPTFYPFNTNIEQGQPLPGPPGLRQAPISIQPYSESKRFEASSTLSTQISPGQTLTAGLQFQQDASYQQPTIQGTFFEESISRSALYVIDDISFGPELKANLGFRYTYSTQFGAVGTPAIGLRYSPNSWLSLRGNGSYVFNAPAITNLFTNSAGVLSNPGLRPETGVTYDLGVDITPASNLGLRLTYFSTSLDGVFTNVNLPNPDVNNPSSRNFGFIFVSQIQNLNSRLASGIEMEALWQPAENLRLRLQWTNTDARNYGLTDSLNQPTFPYFFGYQDSFIPFNNVLLSATYTNRGLTAALIGRYDSGKRRPNSLDFAPAFATMDLNVEVPISPSFTLTGSVLNITDTQYELFPGAPAPGTTFRLGGKLELGV